MISPLGSPGRNFSHSADFDAGLPWHDLEDHPMTPISG